MDDKVTVEFDADTMSALNRMAEAHGRGVDAEVRDIVSRSVRKPMTRAEFVRRANEIADNRCGASGLHRHNARPPARCAMA